MRHNTVVIKGNRAGMSVYLDPMVPFEKLLEDGVDTFIEVGAGKTLCGLIKRMSRTAKIYNVEDAASLAAAVAAVREENA